MMLFTHLAAKIQIRQDCGLRNGAEAECVYPRSSQPADIQPISSNVSISNSISKIPNSALKVSSDITPKDFDSLPSSHKERIKPFKTRREWKLPRKKLSALTVKQTKWLMQTVLIVLIVMIDESLALCSSTFSKYASYRAVAPGALTRLAY
ncbi:uncharacterized protein RAG0_13269 [Rhynchosporium agropyri]|uniref:Uncharacterized protein n=1 Tax=Rhynchosporium agropyri TaxID=914238 RepID=A0A1E1LC32_9HELO|nr:uncharacterized protein RAG0_13269 [Rhynchosporium agropyri]